MRLVTKEKQFPTLLILKSAKLSKSYSRKGNLRGKLSPSKI